MGFAYGGRYGKRVTVLMALHQAIRLLETEIIVFANPLPVAISNISKRISPEINGLFKIILDEMQNNQSGDLYYSFLKTTDYLEKTCLLKADDINVFLSLGKIIGKTNRNDQEQQFKHVYNELDLLILESKEEKNRNEKMYRSLGILLGLGIIIILI
jgi:stage III sporulation protein AB